VPEGGIGESPDAEEPAYASEAGFVVQPDVAPVAVKVASGRGETCYSGAASVAAAEGNPRGTLAALAMVFAPEVDNLAIGESPDAEEPAYASEVGFVVQPDVAPVAVEVASGRGETCYSGAVSVAAAAEGNPRGTLAALAMVFAPEVDNLALDSDSPGDMPESGVAPAVEDGPGLVLVPAAVGVLPEQDMELHNMAGRRRSTEWDSDTSLGESTRAPGPGVCEHTMKAQHMRKHQPA
jgi:hypothetical protein